MTYAEVFNPQTVDSRFERNFAERQFNEQHSGPAPEQEIIWVNRADYMRLVRNYNRLYFVILQLQQELDKGNVKVKAMEAGKPAYNEYLRVTKDILEIKDK